MSVSNQHFPYKCALGWESAMLLSTKTMYAYGCDEPDSFDVAAVAFDISNALSAQSLEWTMSAMAGMIHFRTRMTVADFATLTNAVLESESWAPHAHKSALKR